MAQIIGGWCRDTPWMPKLHTGEQDLWFAGEVLRTCTVRVGFAGGMGFLARRGSEVVALYLAPEARGQGLGAALLGEVKATGAVQLWTFGANAGARRFYRRAGLREVRHTDGAGNDEKLPDIWMEWRA